jgi:predicted Zn-dependent peptidase
MKNLTKLFLSVIIIIVIQGVITAQGLRTEEYKLPNGLTVILNEDHTQPKVFGAIMVKTGGKNDPIDATGMAHYQEHMLFKGTTELGTTNWEKEKVHIDKIFKLYDELGQTTDEEKRKVIQKAINEESIKANEYAIPNETSNIIKQMGGTNLNAGTGPDGTIYYNAFPPNQMEKFLDLYSHRFQNPVFRSFQAELEVVYEEKNLYSDMFIFKILEEFNKVFFKNHPYGQQTLIGTIDDLKNPSLTKMYEFFKTYYVANNMALILSGDFNSEEIKPIIEQKFKALNKGKLPEAKIYKEEEFKGREFVEKKLSPIKLGLLGFRTVPNGHEDEVTLDVCNSILSNEGQTGLLDKLALENKLMQAMCMNMQYNDHGAGIIFVIPKIMGQKLEDAEKLVLDEIAKLKKGEFDKDLLQSIKLEKKKSYLLGLEDLENKTSLLANAFSIGKKSVYVSNYLDKINKITEEDVTRVASKYFGDNYLAFFSKMGFPKKPKIDKPEYEPVVSKTEAKSDYAKKFEKIPSQEITPKYLNFRNEISETDLGNNTTLICTKNPSNNIFSLEIKFGIGTDENTKLGYASDIMNYSGTESKTLSELKQAFGKIGCNYGFSSDESYTYAYIEGFEDQLPEALRLMNDILVNPKIEETKIDIVKEGLKAERKMERSEPESVADALFSYVRYNNKSSYINRLSSKEVKVLTAQGLVDEFKKSLEYAVEIQYTGKLDKDKVVSEIKNNIKFNDNLKATNSPIFKKSEEYNENVIYFVQKKKAIQSKVYFFINGAEYNVKNDPYIEAFNTYFGGGFSGLVLQEIREYRSLAYSAGAYYGKAPKAGMKSDFYGFVGTQADKTIEAVEVFHGLIRDMPNKEYRTDMIKNYLANSAITDVPVFRDRIETIKDWEMKGYKTDPRLENIKVYNNLTYSDINKFYIRNLKEKPTVIAIVGNKKRIDMKTLEKYGKIIYIKEKDLYTK